MLPFHCKPSISSTVVSVAADPVTFRFLVSHANLFHCCRAEVETSLSFPFCSIPVLPVLYVPVIAYPLPSPPVLPCSAFALVAKPVCSIAACPCICYLASLFRSLAAITILSPLCPSCLAPVRSMSQPLPCCRSCQFVA